MGREAGRRRREGGWRLKALSARPQHWQAHRYVGCALGLRGHMAKPCRVKLRDQRTAARRSRSRQLPAMQLTLWIVCQSRLSPDVLAAAGIAAGQQACSRGKAGPGQSCSQSWADGAPTHALPRPGLSALTCGHHRQDKEPHVRSREGHTRLVLLGPLCCADEAGVGNKASL